MKTNLKQTALALLVMSLLLITGFLSSCKKEKSPQPTQLSPVNTSGYVMYYDSTHMFPDDTLKIYTDTIVSNLMPVCPNDTDTIKCFSWQWYNGRKQRNYKHQFIWCNDIMYKAMLLVSVDEKSVFVQMQRTDIMNTIFWTKYATFYKVL